MLSMPKFLWLWRLAQINLDLVRFLAQDATAYKEQELVVVNLPIAIVVKCFDNLVQIKVSFNFYFKNSNLLQIIRTHCLAMTSHPIGKLIDCNRPGSVLV